MTPPRHDPPGDDGGQRRRRRDLEEDHATKARAALRDGRLGEVGDHIDGILDEERPIHDLSGDTTAALMTFVAERLGEDAVEDAWRYVADIVWKPVLLDYQARDDLPGLARAFASFLISHRYEFQVYEDAETWVFEVAFCTSGERMVLEGKVRGLAPATEGHHRFGATARAHPWSLDRIGLPYYDVHSALWMKILPAEWGWDVMDVEYGERTDGCPAVARYVVYKAPRSAGQEP